MLELSGYMVPWIKLRLRKLLYTALISQSIVYFSNEREAFTLRTGLIRFTPSICMSSFRSIVLLSVVVINS